MSGVQIQSEIRAALIEVGFAVGAGPLRLRFKRATEEDAENPRAPWDGDNEDPDEYELLVIEEAFRAHQIDGASVLVSDRRYLAEAGVELPKPGDEVFIAEDRFYLHQVIPESPGGVALFYTLHMRR